MMIYQEIANFTSKYQVLLMKFQLRPNDILNVNYKSSIKNNLDDINYEQIITEIKINNLVTSFEHYNENEFSNKNDYLF